MSGPTRKKIAIRAVFIIYVIILLCEMTLNIAESFGNTTFYKELLTKYFSFGDWLINYEGGFVRRGLTGEILLNIYNYTNIDLCVLTHIISIVSTLILITFTTILFVRKKLSLTILPTVIMMGTFAINEITSFRRDALMLLIIFITLYLYSKYNSVKSSKWAYYLLFNLTGVLLILTHEASFFCFVPYIFIHSLFANSKDGIITKGIKGLGCTIPIIIAMCLVCHFKGNEETANSIWNSYQDYFCDAFDQRLPLGKATEALTWDSIETFKFHLGTNYLMPIHSKIPIPKFFAWAVIYMLTFYLCANVNRIKLFGYEKEEDNYTHLTESLIIQFISLLPMFTILSCDLGRIVLYWTVTSFFIYALFDKETRNIPFITNLSNWTNRIFNTRILYGRKLYLFISITIMCPLIMFAIVEAIKTSVIGNIYNFIQRLLTLI